MYNANAPVIKNPVMLDRVIAEIQTGLIENLPWLDVAFGRSQRLTKMMNGKRIVTPNVYCGGWNGHGENDYIETSPDAKIGNFSFFEIEDPQTIEPGPWARQIKAPFSLIIWFDLTRIYNESSNRNTEYVKAQILHVLNGRAGWHLTNGRVVVNKVYERAENIYRGYTLSEINNQFLIHPFAGFRFDGLLEYDEYCFADWPIIPIIPDVPTGAYFFDAPRFAIDTQGNAQIFRTRGNSEIINGEIEDLKLLGWRVVGYNQINPHNIVWESTSDGYNARTDVIKIVPGCRYVVYFNSITEMVNPRDYHITCRMKNGEVLDFPVDDGVAFDIPENADQMFFGWTVDYGGYRSDVIVAIYDGEAVGSPVYYSKNIELDVTALKGIDYMGIERTIFPYGLMSSPDGICDEIFENLAVRRVMKRSYIPGDETNPLVITDGTFTNYSLPKPEIFKIVPSLELVFIAERGCTVFQNPETPTALLDIVID